MVSILMPVHNGQPVLKDCIHSVLTNDYTDFEFIIVNDGSTDKTEEIIRSFTDPRIKYFKIPHSGISAARQKAFDESKGEIIAIHDSDVIMLPNRITFGLKRLEDVFYSSFVGFVKGTMSDPVKVKDINKQTLEEILDPSIPAGNQCVPNFTILAKRECFEGAYIPEYEINDDLWTIYWWKKQGYKFTFSRKALCIHIITGNNVSNKTDEVIKVANKIRRKEWSQ